MPPSSSGRSPKEAAWCCSRGEFFLAQNVNLSIIDPAQNDPTFRAPDIDASIYHKPSPQFCGFTATCNTILMHRKDEKSRIHFQVNQPM